MQGACDLEIMRGTGQNLIRMVIQKGKIQCVALPNHLSKCYLQQVVATPLWSPLPCLPLLLSHCDRKGSSGAWLHTGDWEKPCPDPLLGELKWGKWQSRTMCVLDADAAHRGRGWPSFLREAVSRTRGQGRLGFGLDLWLMQKGMLLWAVVYFAAQRTLQSCANLSVIFNYLSQFTCSCLCLVITAAHTLLFWRSQWFWSLTLPLQA